MTKAVIAVLEEVLERLPRDSQTARELRIAIQELREVDPNHPPDFSKPLATLRRLYDELEDNPPVSHTIAMAAIALEGALKISGTAELRPF